MSKRIDGRYYTRVDIGGGKYKDVYGKTQREAENKALDLRIKVKKGINIEAQRDTWGYWSDKWLETKLSCADGQYGNYCIGAKHFDSLSSRKISDIRSSDIKKIINDLTQENPFTHRPSAKRTLQFAKSVAVQIFAEAIDDRVIDYNPALSVKVASETPHEKRKALTAEQQGWIINTPHRAQRPSMIMMYSGIRLGELIPLTWNDIDFESHTIRVKKSAVFFGSKSKPKGNEELGLSYRNKTIVKDYVKSESGYRTVKIPQKLVEYLKTQPRDNILVCPSAHGKMMTESAWKALWKSYVKELNNKYGKQVKTSKSKFAHASPITIPPITAHWLRHTFATLLYLAGVDILTAKEQLGHADVKTTLNIYTHLDQEFKDKDIAKLDYYLDQQFASGLF